MPIKNLDVAWMKVTGEPVFVISIVEDKASIKRPMQTRDGIQYSVESVLLAELETQEEKFDREYDEMFHLQERSKSKKESKGLSVVPN